MNVFIDVGGTNFRYYVYSCNNRVKLKSKSLLIDKENTLKQFDKVLIDIFEEFKEILSITVSLPGIVDQYKFFGVNNLNIPDDTILSPSFQNIKIKYINDGDAFIIGETIDKLLTPKNKNIMGLMFGNGVCCGLIINGSIIWNSEVNTIFEPFMSQNYLTSNNVETVTDFIAIKVVKLVSLLNLDYIVIGGYVTEVENFVELLQDKINIRKFYGTKIIFSKSKNSILRGLQYYGYLIDDEIR